MQILVTGGAGNVGLHMIPLVLRAAKGELPELTIFGTDYDMPNGAYIHIVDLCDAHVLELQHLTSGGESRAYDLGYELGYPMKEVIQVAERATGNISTCNTALAVLAIHQD